MFEIIKIEDKEFYAVKSDYFENEQAAENEGFYWDDELSMWTKEIINSATTVFRSF